MVPPLFLLLLSACDPLSKVDEADTDRTRTFETGRGWREDEDGDGWPVSDGDCDDSNPDINPDSEDVCDGVDNNCNGEIDEDVLTESFADADGDGFGDPEDSWLECEPAGGRASNGEDCDDTRGTVYPGAAEACDGLDNDCDAAVDEGPWAIAADAAWDALGVTLTISGGCGAYDLGMAQTGAGDAGWYGEACNYAVRGGDTGETGDTGLCHVVAAAGGHLDTVGSDVEPGDTTTRFGEADEASLTYVLRAADGTCLAWGESVEWYAALGCIAG